MKKILFLILLINFIYPQEKWKFKNFKTFYNFTNRPATDSTYPITLTSDQSSIAQNTFKFTVPTGKTITVNWGGGGATNDVIVGNNTEQTVVSDYSVEGEYTVTVEGDWLYITTINIVNQPNISGDVSGWSALTSLTYLSCYSTSVSGDVSSWSALTSLTYLSCYSTSVSGDVSSWSALINLTALRCEGTLISGDVSSWSALINLTALRCEGTLISGDVSSWSALINLTVLRCFSTLISGDVSSWSALTSLTYLSCYSTSVSGDVSGWSALTSLTYLSCYSTSVSGDVSSWSALINLTALRCYSTSVDFDNQVIFEIAGINYYYDCLMDSTQVNNILISYAAGTKSGGILNVAGNNAARTATSDAAKATLLGRSWTITVNE